MSNEIKNIQLSININNAKKSFQLILILVLMFASIINSQNRIHQQTNSIRFGIIILKYFMN